MRLNVPKIEMLMAQKHLKQTTLSEICGCSRQYVGQILRSGRAGIGTATMLAEVLECDVQDICDPTPDKVRFIPEALNSAMFSKRLNMKRLAGLAGITPQTVSKAVHGEAVTVRIANRIAWVLETNLETITERSANNGA